MGTGWLLLGLELISLLGGGRYGNRWLQSRLIAADNALFTGNHNSSTACIQ